MSFRKLCRYHIIKILPYLKNDYQTLAFLFAIKVFRETIKSYVQVEWYTIDCMIYWGKYVEFTILSVKNLNNYYDVVHVLYDYGYKTKTHYFENIVKDSLDHKSIVKMFAEPYNIIETKVKSLF